MYYCPPDHLGSVEVVLDEDANVVERRDTLPYGTSRSLFFTGVPHGNYTVEPRSFTGKELDTQTGLHYYGARYYDSEIGRFTTIDPLVLDEAKTTPEDLLSILSNPQKLNAYTYVLNNPLMYTDPFGESEFTDRWKGYGNIVDGGLTYFVGGNIVKGALKANQIGQVAVGIAAQKIGIFEAAIGTAQAINSNDLEWNTTSRALDKGVGTIVKYSLSGADKLTRTAKLFIARPGYSDALEAISGMAENNVTPAEFRQSIIDATIYERDKVKNYIANKAELIKERFGSRKLDNKNGSNEKK